MRSACGFFAGCMLARGRSAPRRLRPRSRAWGSRRYARRGSVLPMIEKGPPAEEGVAYFKLWSSEPLVKISHSCQCGALVQRVQHIIHLQPPGLLQKTTESGSTSCARLRVARPLIYEVLSQIKNCSRFGKDAVSTITRCETSSASPYASSSHASSARSVLPCKCAAAQVVPPPRWATTKPPKDY